MTDYISIVLWHPRFESSFHDHRLLYSPKNIYQYTSDPIPTAIYFPTKKVSTLTTPCDPSQTYFPNYDAPERDHITMGKYI